MSLKNKRNKRLLNTLIIITSLAIPLLFYEKIIETADKILESGIETFGYYGVAITVFIIEFIPQPFLSATIPYIIGIIFGLESFYLIIITIIFAILANYLAYTIGLIYGHDISKYFISETNYNKSKK